MEVYAIAKIILRIQAVLDAYLENLAKHENLDLERARKEAFTQYREAKTNEEKENARKNLEQSFERRSSNN